MIERRNEGLGSVIIGGLEFILDEKLIVRKRVLPLLNEAHELSSIFITTRKTAQRNKSINNQQSSIERGGKGDGWRKEKD